MELRGNNFVSKEELTDIDFDGKLRRVTVLDNETQKAEILEDQVLVQCIEYNGEYWFILRDKSSEEKFAEENEVLAGAIEELAAIIGDL